MTFREQLRGIHRETQRMKEMQREADRRAQEAYALYVQQIQREHEAGTITTTYRVVRSSPVTPP